jgi:hypothetical protein
MWEGFAGFEIAFKNRFHSFCQLTELLSDRISLISICAVNLTRVHSNLSPEPFFPYIISNQSYEKIWSAFIFQPLILMRNKKMKGLNVNANHFVIILVWRFWCVKKWFRTVFCGGFDRASWIIWIITNTMHCLSSVYWLIAPLHVLGISAAHYQAAECGK